MSLLGRLRQWFAGAKAVPDAALSAQERAGIDHNVQVVREHLSGLAGHDLSPGRAGVEFLDGFLERNREQWDDETKAKLAQTAGCYLGAALIAEYGGRWVRDATLGDSLAVEVTPQLVCYPLAKAHKHVFDGPGDSVRAFFNSQPLSIASANAGELGANEPTRAGSLRKELRNRSRSAMAGSSLSRMPMEDAPLRERARVWTA